MLYYKNPLCNLSAFDKITTLNYLPSLSHVWPALIPPMFHGYPKTLFYPLLLLLLPTAHDTTAGVKWFCACALGTISTVPQEITTQTNWVLAIIQSSFLFRSFFCLPFVLVKLYLTQAAIF